MKPFIPRPARKALLQINKPGRRGKRARARLAAITRRYATPMAPRRHAYRAPALAVRRAQSHRDKKAARA